jgi:predicted Zn finger-like uncharacterized protein
VIIQCKKCGTKYRFDKSQIDGEGIWLRCNHCKEVFFQENPLAGIASLTGSIEPGEEIHEKEYETTTEEINRIFMEVEGGDGEQEPEHEELYSGSDKAKEETSEDEGEEEDINRILMKDEAEDDAQKLEQEEAYSDAVEIIDNAEASEEVQKLRSPGKKIAIFLILVILLSGGIYLWTSPRAIESILNRVLPQVEKFIGTLPGVERFFGTESSDIPNECVSGLGVDLINVKERFVKNWVAGDVLVIEGFAVNNNKCAVSDIRVMGKILDSSGDILAEEEFNCGNILTDDELRSLTEKEIMKELSNSYGRDFSNADIEPGADIPFMLAFIMPAGKASEFLVELAGIEFANIK